MDADTGLHTIDFVLDIDPDALMLYYEGKARHVVVCASDGRTVRFPLRVLRQFVNHSGVHGRFRLYHDGSGKFVRMERVP